MNSYEKLIKTIRNESNRDKGTSIRLGSVENDKIKVGMLDLEKTDFLINPELKIANGDKVLIANIEDVFVIICKVVDM
nr:MAG TPA: hypothetical protein [Caudoviricetes sp.]